MLAIRLISALLTLLVIGLVWQLIEYWGLEPAYGDRLLVLGAAGWLVYRNWDDWLRLPQRMNFLGVIPLLLGLVLIPPVWNLFAQVGPRTILLWWYTLGLVCLLSGIVWFHFGFQRFRFLAFPLIFVFFSLPLPQRVHDVIQGQLQNQTTVMAANSLSWLGVRVERQGFQLHLPSGDLEVVEACSGIRSVTALMAIAALVAHLRGYGALRGILLFSFSFPIIVLCNVIRIVVTGLIQEGFGPEWVQGFAHDLLGFLVILVGLACILITSQLLLPRDSSINTIPNGIEIATGEFRDSDKKIRSLWWSCWLILVCLVASAICYSLGKTSVREQSNQIDLESLPLELLRWQGQDLDLPEAVKTQLAPEKVLRRIYRNRLGQEVELFVLFWSSNRTMRGYHHPEVCWPNHGWTLEAREMLDLPWNETSSMPLTIRKYRRNSSEQLVCYWTQEGNRLWTEADEQQLRRVDSFGLIRERLFQSRPPESGRMAFLIAGELAGNRQYAQQSMIQLIREIASQIYDRNPWADLRPSEKSTPKN